MDEGYDKLVQHGLRLVSKKRYTIKMMQKKLTDYADKRDEIDRKFVKKVMDRLEELGYLNDEKYIKDYVAQCNRIRPRGRMVLVRELKRKGIPKVLIDKHLDDTQVDDVQVVSEMLKKRTKRWEKYPIFEQKHKAYQFLYSKGFSRDSIYKAIDQCYNHKC